MKLIELKRHLEESHDSLVRFVLPGGNTVPAAYHLTEVGHVTKNFIDCGGTRRSSEACVLQLWLGDDEAHRLRADKFLRILEMSREIVPSESLSVEVEYEAEVISQYPIAASHRDGDAIVLELATKHTDCLARQLYLPPENLSDDACCSASSRCC
jgi:hypothetical protein